eukprot:TRINITY_DN4466_c0_g1_i4.p1 TRINITY_DN4466_c0_g1~~TRINITY_DN4466_c0_g1_i4.p1  ORF type:complete len:532 (+),score=102.68 TRINITY_DN4466_c0_g1_i4:66-1661(+)
MAMFLKQMFSDLSPQREKVLLKVFHHDGGWKGFGNSSHKTAFEFLKGKLEKLEAPEQWGVRNVVHSNQYCNCFVMRVIRNVYEDISANDDINDDIVLSKDDLFVDEYQKTCISLQVLALALLNQYQAGFSHIWGDDGSLPEKKDVKTRRDELRNALVTPSLNHTRRSVSKKHVRTKKDEKAPKKCTVEEIANMIDGFTSEEFAVLNFAKEKEAECNILEFLIANKPYSDELLLKVLIKVSSSLIVRRPKAKATNRSFIPKSPLEQAFGQCSMSVIGEMVKRLSSHQLRSVDGKVLMVRMVENCGKSDADEAAMILNHIYANRNRDKKKLLDMDNDTEKFPLGIALSEDDSASSRPDSVWHFLIGNTSSSYKFEILSFCLDDKESACWEMCLKMLLMIDNKSMEQKFRNRTSCPSWLIRILKHGSVKHIDLVLQLLPRLPVIVKKGLLQDIGRIYKIKQIDEFEEFNSDGDYNYNKIKIDITIPHENLKALCDACDISCRLGDGSYSEDCCTHISRVSFMYVFLSPLRSVVF